MKNELPANPSYDAASARRLPVQRAWVYQPQMEWMYSHHPHLAFFGVLAFALLAEQRFGYPDGVSGYPSATGGCFFFCHYPRRIIVSS